MANIINGCYVTETFFVSVQKPPCTRAPYIYSSDRKVYEIRDMVDEYANIEKLSRKSSEKRAGRKTAAAAAARRRRKIGDVTMSETQREMLLLQRLAWW